MPLLGGVRPPLVALMTLLLIASAVTVPLMSASEQDEVPEAIRSAQQHVAEDSAISLHASLNESVSDLKQAARQGSSTTPTPEGLLASLGSSHSKWNGTAVVDTASGTVLAARGAKLPASALYPLTGGAEKAGAGSSGTPRPRVDVAKDGTARLLTFARVRTATDGQTKASGSTRPALLVGALPMRLTDTTTGNGHTIAVVDSKGRTLSTQGHGPNADSRGSAVATTVAEQVAEERQDSQANTRTAATRKGAYDAPSGSMLDTSDSGLRTVTGYAALRAGEDVGDLKLSVLSTVEAEPDRRELGNKLFAAGAAGTLILLAVGMMWLLNRTLQRPLLTLHLEGRRIARGSLEQPVSGPRFGEPARIGAALERLRGQLVSGAAAEDGERADADGSLVGSGPPPRPAGRMARLRSARPGVRAVVVLCAVVLVAWSVPMLLMFNRADAVLETPGQTVSDQRQRTEMAASRIRGVLNEGEADLTALAGSVRAASGKQETEQELRSALQRHSRYQALYLADPDGRITARAGDSPKVPADDRSGGASGLRLLDNDPKRPLIVVRTTVGEAAEEDDGARAVSGRQAAARTDPAGTRAGDERVLIGELRGELLHSILYRPGLGRAWLVDDNHRIVAAGQGFRAFQQLAPSRLRQAADATSQGAVGELNHGWSTTVTTAAPLSGAGQDESPASALTDWNVVVDKPTSWLELPEYDKQYKTMSAGLLVLTGGLLCLGWLHLVVVRPLRALAGRAEALADGDRRSVLYPVHQDEVGSVTRSLELARQRLCASDRRES